MIVGSRIVGRLVGSVGSPVGMTGRQGDAGVDVEVEVDRQVGVVAHVQVARDLRVAADDLVDERVGQEHVEGRWRSRRRRRPAGRAPAAAGCSESMVAALDAVITRTPTSPSSAERLEHLDQVGALLVDRGRARRAAPRARRRWCRLLLVGRPRAG